jgi:prevent-host-death family protein
MASRVSATEAVRKFSELLDRVRYRGESFDVVCNGEIVARITTADPRSRATAADLIAIFDAVGRADASFAEDLERVQAEQLKLPDDSWGS